MKIVIIDWSFFGKQDIIDALSGLGHEILLFSHPDYDLRVSDSFLADFNAFLSGHSVDCVYSSNFFPLVSTACMKKALPYISWVYDCPHLSLFSATILNSCNYVFIFDSSIYNTLKKSGINTVYYLPLAANTNRLDSLIVTEDIRNKLSCDISFVGSLYNEQHNLFERLSGVGAHTAGYLDAIISAQQKISGYNFIEELLTPDILDDLERACPFSPNPDGVETAGYVYAKFFIDRKITQIERMNIIKTLSEKFNFNLYTHNHPDSIPMANYVGAVDPYTTQPYIFKCSKINLNISLRSIESGIPLRVFDIMGAGGFVMTNYQSDMFELFTPDEDFVYYDGIDDLSEKCKFYLAHDDIRTQIAANGHAKIKAYHSYEARFKEIFSIVFN